MQYLINSLHDLKVYQTGENKINFKIVSNLGIYGFLKCLNKSQDEIKQENFMGVYVCLNKEQISTHSDKFR